MEFQILRDCKINSNFQNLPAQKTTQHKSNKIKAVAAVIGGLAMIAAGTILAYYAYRVPEKNVIKGKSQDAVNKVKQNFLNLCKSATCENFRATRNNVDNGIFAFDLHSHSTHSDGWAYVRDLLDEVADYANHVYEKTGKKFTFALTDHDRVSGTKEALEIIRSNPERYKNINFVPGIELSFAFNSNGKVKFGEVLAYFVKPDSPEMTNLIEELNSNRRKMLDEGIKRLGDGFSRAEMNDYFINHDGETFAYCLHYRLLNYAQIKNRINRIAEERGVDANQLYKKLMQEYVFGNGERVRKPDVCPSGFDEYLKRKNFATQTPILDESITKICEEFFPKIVNGHIVSETENSFEKIIDTLKNDDDVILAFAHPYYIARVMDDYRKEFPMLLKIANGKILMSEIYYQGYTQGTLARHGDDIAEINDFLLSQNLIPIGGRDSHKKHFLELIS